jgi:hypothetical protein
MTTLQTIAYIAMAISWAVMLIVSIFQHKRIKELNANHGRLLEEGWRKYMGYGKRYKEIMRFLDPKAMPQARLDEEVKKYQDEGYHFAKDESVCGLLAFRKHEEVEDDE